MPLDNTNLPETAIKLQTMMYILRSPRYWVKGAINAEGMRSCLVGAMCYAVSNELLDRENNSIKLSIIIKKAIDELYPGYEGIPVFNDDWKTRWKDVNRVLQRAFELSLAQEQ